MTEIRRENWQKN